MNVLKVIAFAEIRHAAEQAEQQRLAQQAVAPRRGRKRWGNAVRDELVTLRARMSAVPRQNLTQSTDLASAATETT